MEAPPNEPGNSDNRPAGSEIWLNKEKGQDDEDANAGASTSNDAKEDISNKRKRRTMSDDKLEERRQANRRSAMESRERKKKLILDLQNSVAMLTEENKRLNTMADTMRFELQAAVLENQQLRLILGQVFPQGLPLFPGAVQVGTGNDGVTTQAPVNTNSVNTNVPTVTTNLPAVTTNVPTGTTSVPTGGVNAQLFDASAVSASAQPSGGNVKTVSAVAPGSIQPTEGNNNPVMGAGTMLLGAVNMPFASSQGGTVAIIPGFSNCSTAPTTASILPATTTESQPEIPNMKNMKPHDMRGGGSQAEAGNIMS